MGRKPTPRLAYTAGVLPPSNETRGLLFAGGRVRERPIPGIRFRSIEQDAAPFSLRPAAAADFKECTLTNKQRCSTLAEPSFPITKVNSMLMHARYGETQVGDLWARSVTTGRVCAGGARRC